MNIAMEQTEEWKGGHLTSKLGDAFIRGNNGEATFRPSAWNPLPQLLLNKTSAVSLWCFIAVMYISAVKKRG
jgi:hypothetical protein